MSESDWILLTGKILISILFVGLAALSTKIILAYVRLPKNIASTRNQTILSALKNIIWVIAYSIAIIFILRIFNVDMTPILASAGIAGIVIGLSARPVVEDFINGIFLLTQKSIFLGDFVKIDEDEGYIESIGLRTLTLRDTSGAIHIIPNGNIKRLINYSRHKKIISIKIPVLATQKLDIIKEAIKKTLIELKKDQDLVSLIYSDENSFGVNNIAFGKYEIEISITSKVHLEMSIKKKFFELLIKNFEKKELKF